MKILVHPAYLATIPHYAALAKADSYVFEACDNYQKQTYRNRTFIYGANGKLQLNVPTRHSQSKRQLYKDVKIAYDTNWQLLHKKSIETAYRTSPFYEFYQDVLLSIFIKKENFLYDLNIKCHENICDCLEIPFNVNLTASFIEKPIDLQDERILINAKRDVAFDQETYSQVFDDKHGFIKNLSVLDLICNEGPNSFDYLKRQKITEI